MTREQVVDYLNGYAAYKARADFLAIRAEELGGIIREVKAHAAYYATSTTPAYTGMPGGGPVESKVERIAITLAEGRLPGDLRELETEAEEVRVERQMCERRCRCVDAWLNVLNPRERLVITEHCLNGRVWRETAEMFNRAFNEGYSKSGLKAVMERGVDKICEVAK